MSSIGRVCSNMALWTPKFKLRKLQLLARERNAMWGRTDEMSHDDPIERLGTRNFFKIVRSAGRASVRFRKRSHFGEGSFTREAVRSKIFVRTGGKIDEYPYSLKCPERRDF